MVLELRILEPELPTAYECRVLRTLVCGGKDALDVAVAPPVPAYKMGTVHPVERVLLSARYVGTAITPTLSERPCYVNLAVADSQADWEAGRFRHAAIGAIQEKKVCGAERAG